VPRETTSGTTPDGRAGTAPFRHRSSTFFTRRTFADPSNQPYFNTLLGACCGVPDLAVAVRSSALDEDGSAASFAGQHETFLNVRGLAELHVAIERCLQSARSPRALAYRRDRGLGVSDARLTVLVQQLVIAEASGVVFSANPMTGARGEAVVTTSWGLGESIVGGTVSPDMFVVRTADMRILARQIATKLRMTVTVQSGAQEIDVPERDRDRPSVSDAQCIDAVRMAITLEDEVGWPADIECAWQDGICYLLQYRPITTPPNLVGGVGHAWGCSC
jgi:pyruvate,water dikinase